MGEKFNIIYADPPWKFQTYSERGSQLVYGTWLLDTFQLGNMSAWNKGASVKGVPFHFAGV